MGIEREIRFLVTDGEPPTHSGRKLEQAYLLRYPATLRVRLVEGQGAKLTLKWPRREGNYEWEITVPVRLAKALLALPLPRIEKSRFVEGDLEVDLFSWPKPLILIECELPPKVGPSLADNAGRAAWMNARRPAWVRTWEDVTGQGAFNNAALARTRRTRSRAPVRNAD